MKPTPSVKKVVSKSSPSVSDIKVGKDILELLSSSMYVDPMSIYREYIQNAADSVDAADSIGLYPKNKSGEVNIRIDSVGRVISIKDNGAGVSIHKAVSTLLAFGGSSKRGTAARGFRGVGRLAGLGYCQELIFRTKAGGEKKVTELQWDGRKLKEALRSGQYSGSLADLVSSVVTVSTNDSEDAEDHFFEVVLSGIVRHRNDVLLNADAVRRYLSEVAPVPFNDEFVFAETINKVLKTYLVPSRLTIKIDGDAENITRPHREYPASPTEKPITFKDLKTIEIPDVDGNVGAILWLIHHEYTGAIPNQVGYKGLRFRTGNIQVGDNSLVEDLYTEPRFNHWTIGEVHVIDSRILPNGRRDHFESNIHFDNLRNQLGPIAREISKRCRSSSIIRNALRKFGFHEKDIKEKLEILRQGGISKGRRRLVASGVREALLAMEKIAGRDIVPEDERSKLRKSILALRNKFEKTQSDTKNASAGPLARFSPAKRSMYEQFFELVYACSVNQAAAKLLVERILTKLT